MPGKIWKKVATTKKLNGESTVVWTADGCDCTIESRKRLIPHANRSGGWLYTTYFLKRPDGTEKEYFRMSEAKEEAERVNTKEH